MLSIKKKMVIDFSIFLVLTSIAVSSFSPLGRINYYDHVHPGDDVVVSVNLHNDLSKDFKNTRVSAYLMDTDAFSVTPRFRFEGKDQIVKRLSLSVPEDLPPGEYLVKVTASNSDFRRTKYRYLIVD